MRNGKKHKRATIIPKSGRLGDQICKMNLFDLSCSPRSTR